MASNPRFMKQESTLDSAILLIRRTYHWKHADEDILYDLKCCLKTRDFHTVGTLSKKVSKPMYYFSTFLSVSKNQWILKNFQRSSFTPIAQLVSSQLQTSMYLVTV